MGVKLTLQSGNMCKQRLPGHLFEQCIRLTERCSSTVLEEDEGLGCFYTFLWFQVSHLRPTALQTRDRKVSGPAHL